MKYLLDANTYIEAKNFYYGMDICPAYWQWLDWQFELGTVASVDMIGRELRDGDDELAQCARQRPAHFVANDDEATQQIFQQILSDVMAGDYNARERDNFLAKADPWIIAKSKAIGATLITHESLLPVTSRKIRIPNICQNIEVPWMNTFQFLRQLNARFVLEAR